ACTTCLQLVCPDLIAFWMSVIDFSSTWNELPDALCANDEAVLSGNARTITERMMELRIFLITVFLLLLPVQTSPACRSLPCFHPVLCSSVIGDAVQEACTCGLKPRLERHLEPVSNLPCSVAT